jgi:hypothetical protein
VRGLTRILFLGGAPRFEAFSQALALAVNGNYSGFDYTRDLQAFISTALINNAGPTFCSDLSAPLSLFPSRALNSPSDIPNKTYAAYSQLMRDVGAGSQYGSWTVNGLFVVCYTLEYKIELTLGHL